MKSLYEKITKENRKKLLNSLKEFVAINSVYDENTADDNDPFGKGVSDALNYICNLAKQDGFEATNYGNKVVEILCGSGDKNITIMAHADVVPAGTGWKHEPFSMHKRCGVLGGRGVADDKGPLLAAYYAMKSLRDYKLIDGYKVRFLVGGNEESGSRGIEYYFHDLKKEQPTLGFSPDSDFPLIFAEKGIINFLVEKNIELTNIQSITGGVASNSVIEKCEVVLKEQNGFCDYCTRNNYNFEKVDEKTVVFLGKAAHGAIPELGVNAGMLALKAIADYTCNDELKMIVNMYTPLDASGYNCASLSKEMGHNSSNIGLISYKNGELNITVNFRYTDACKKEDLISNIKKVNKDLKITILAESPLLYYDKNSVLISTLLKSYQDETGDTKTKPLAIGGGTYAKEADNVVAFGMQFPGWESNMHSPVEAVRIKDLYKGMAIFARAIFDLGQKVK